MMLEELRTPSPAIFSVLLLNQGLAVLFGDVWLWWRVSLAALRGQFCCTGESAVGWESNFRDGIHHRKE